MQCYLNLWTGLCVAEHLTAMPCLGQTFWLSSLSAMNVCNGPGEMTEAVRLHDVLPGFMALAEHLWCILPNGKTETLGGESLHVRAFCSKAMMQSLTDFWSLCHMNRLWAGSTASWASCGANLQA